MTDVPTPIISGRADGYWATCQVCGLVIAVPVTDIMLTDSDHLASNDAAVTTIAGHTSSFDLSAYTAHYEGSH